jgi:flagellar basal-body rod protein FlgG
VIKLIRGLYTAASGMITKQLQQENISNNIANINTPGFKSDKISLKSFEDMLIETRDKQIGSSNFKHSLGTLEFGVGIDANRTNFSQGLLEDTGRNLDFAINGNGFFTVLKNDGSERYTRDGRFEIDSNGFLTTVEGDRILGVDSNGNKIPIKLSSDKVNISSEGVIENSEGQARFYLSNFTNDKDLVKEGTNYYRTNLSPLGEASGKVEQQKLEKSNVDTLEAITDMISIMRSYESSQKVIQQMDETLGKTVNEVGSTK